jgi:hypothetical protein
MLWFVVAHKGGNSLSLLCIPFDRRHEVDFQASPGLPPLDLGMAASMLKLVLSLATAGALALLGSSPAAAGPPRPSEPVGVDVSWPQCGKALPDKPAFAIVGVNNGLANTTNPCLADQLAWAANSTGTTSQPAAALYVNTANPGTAGSWWPTSNTYMDVVVENPYGDCASGDFRACSYMYGYAKAYDDANLRGVDNPGGQFWWLDVETGNSWQTDKAANVADLEGMAAYFTSINAEVGIYSTGSQWGQVAGAVPSESELAGLPSWLAGARSLKGAKSNCSLAGLTPGSRVSVTQFISGGLDHDYACP